MNPIISSPNIVAQQSWSLSSFGGTLVARRQGRVVSVSASYIGSKTAIPTGNERTFATLPEIYRPKEVKVAYGPSSGTATPTTAVPYYINTNGTVTVIPYTAISGGSFSISYVV